MGRALNLEPPRRHGKDPARTEPCVVVHGLDIGTVQESLHTSPRAGRTRSGPVLWSRRPGIAVQGFSGAFSGGGSRRRRGAVRGDSGAKPRRHNEPILRKAPETLGESATGWLSRVEERRVAGRGSVAYPALSQPGRRPSPVGTFPPPALRTRRADFRHRALQWNHAARARASRSRPADGSREPWHQARTLAPAGRCVVRPVDALATATARVVPFACACDDIRHSCSSPG